MDEKTNSVEVQKKSTIEMEDYLSSNLDSETYCKLIREDLFYKDMPIALMEEKHSEALVEKIMDYNRNEQWKEPSSYRVTK